MGPFIEPFPRDLSVWKDLAVIPRQPARAGYNDMPPGKRFAPVAYDDFDFWLGLEGRSTVEVLGRPRSLDAGTCMLLPPCVVATQWIAPDTNYRLAYFHFDIAHQGRIVRDARRYVREASDAPGASLVLALPGVPPLALFTTLDATRLAERLMRTVRRWDDAAQLESVAAVTAALAEHRRAAVRPTGARGDGLSAVDAALQFLEDNLNRPVFVADVADHVRLSPTHLTRLFRVQLKESPMQALLRMRLARAHALLRDPALNIGEVASACGFESLSFFTRVFARKFGCPPTSFRRGLQTPRGGPPRRQPSPTRYR